MTLQEIFNRTAVNLYGDSPLPAGAESRIQESVLIFHKEIQSRYNFWFMFESVSFSDALQVHNLPDDFKDLIFVYTQDSILSRIPEGYARIAFRTNPEGDPRYYIINDGQIAFYPAPPVSVNSTLEYYKYFNIAAWSAAANDDVTLYAADYIINKASADVSVIHSEHDKAGLYNKAAEGDFMKLVELDKIRKIWRNKR